MADAPGTFHGLSSHFSGDGFSDMHFDVQAVPAEQFAAWIDDHARHRSNPRCRELRALWPSRAWTTQPFTYRATDPGLFQQIVTQKLPPGPGPQTGRPNRERIAADGALACWAS